MTETLLVVSVTYHQVIKTITAYKIEIISKAFTLRHFRSCLIQSKDILKSP